MAKQIKKDDIKIQIKTGTVRDLLVTWKFDYTPEKNIASYDWEWHRYTNKQWVDGVSGSTTHPLLTAEFSVPEDAKMIRFRVRPVSKTNEDTDLSGVDKSSDSDSKTTHYFQGSWSDWVTFKEWAKTTNPPVLQVNKITIKKVAAVGGGYDLRAAHSLTKKLYEERLPFLSGFQYQWEGWDGRDWTSISGTVDSIYNGNTVVEPEKASSGSIDLKDAAKNLIRGGNTLTVYHKVHLQSAFKSYRITISPVPSNEYDFLPLERSAITNTTAPVKQLTEKQIAVLTKADSSNFYVFWYATDKSFFQNDDGVNLVSGFQVTWEYMKDLSVWNGALPAGDKWDPGDSETVDIEDRIEYNTTVDITKKEAKKAEKIWVKGGLKQEQEDVIAELINSASAKKILATASGVSTDDVKSFKQADITVYQWSYIFALPEGVKPETEARVKIKVLAADSGTFTEEWSSWIPCKRTIPIEEESSTIKHLYSSPSSARRVEVLLTKFDTQNISGFSYNWYYVLASDHIFRSGGSGTIDITQTTEGTIKAEDIKRRNGEYFVDPGMTLEELRASDMYKWSTYYDAPVEAVAVVLELSSIPSYEGAFVPFVHRCSYDITIPLRRIYSVVFQVDDAESRTVIASWEPIVDENLQSYECIWEYFDKGFWREAQTGSTSKSSIKDMEGSETALPYSTFSVPEDIKKIRLAVRPTAKSEDIFKGDWGNYWVYPIEPETIKPSPDDIEIKRDAGTARRLLAVYTQKAQLPKDVENVIFDWSYLLNGEWRSEDGGGEKPSPKEYCNSTFDIPENAEKVRVRLKADIENIEYLGEWSDYKEYNTVIPIHTITDVVVQTFRGSDRSVIANWIADTSMGEIESYTYKWRYYLNGFWFPESEGTASVEDALCTYQVPERSYLVDFRVKANPKYEIDFKGEYLQPLELTVIDDPTPEVPSVPSLELKKNTYTFTASVDVYDRNTQQVEFSVIEDTRNIVWATGVSDVVFNKAVFTFTALAGKGYKVRARGINSDGMTMEDIGETGEDGWSQYSAVVETRPLAPKFTEHPVTALTRTSMRIEFEEVENADSYELEYTKKKAYFDTGGPTTTITSIINRVEIESLESGAYYFRVRAVNDAGNSDWSDIVSGSCGTVPEAPTTWSSRLNAVIDSDIFLYWTHNSEDGSKESKAMVELTVNGVTTEVEIVKPEDNTDQSFYKIPSTYLEDEATIQWRVRTMGIETLGYGPYSTQRIIKIYSPPTVAANFSNSNAWTWDNFNFNEDSIYSADGNRNILERNIIEAFPILIYLDAGPAAQTPVAYSLTITSNSNYETSDVVGNTRQIINGQVIFSRNLNTREHSLVTMIMPGEIDLENGMSYTLHVTLAMDSGLTAETSVIFSTSFEVGEYDIDAEIGFDRSRLIAYITPFCNDEYGVRATDVTLSVYRKEFDGGFTLIADDISNEDRPTVTDPHPNLDYARYRVVARSNTTGKTEYYDIPGYPVGVTSIVLQWNESHVSYDAMNLDERDSMARAGSLVRLPYNVDTTDSNQVDVEMVEYIGRSHPVSYFGTQVGQKATWSAVIPKTDKQTIYDLRRLARYMGNVYVREPSGTGYWAHVEVSFNLTHLETTVPVSLSVTRVEGGM